jgi:hypothetical protein
MYRNNDGIFPYPFKAGNLFSITGNTAISPLTESDTTYYKFFYYYFYDMHVKSVGCPSIDRQAVTLNKPVITQNGEILNSSFAAGNQWFLNGQEIKDATGPTDTPLQSGKYEVGVIIQSGCTIKSDVYTYALIARNPDRSTDIGLTIFPVPAISNLNVVFVAQTDGDLTLSLFNTAGQMVYQQQQAITAGNFSTVINVGSQLPGTYMLKVMLGKKIYSKKIIITK